MGKMGKAKAAVGTAGALFSIGNTARGAVKSPVMPPAKQYANAQTTGSSGRLDGVRKGTAASNARKGGSSGKK
jgi:hypothetical protein